MRNSSASTISYVNTSININPLNSSTEIASLVNTSHTSPYARQNETLAGAGLAEANFIWMYGAPCLIIFGIVGNVLSILVFQRNAMQKMTVRLLLTALAVVDIIMLLVGFTHDWLYRISNTRIYIRHTSSVMCKSQLFLLVSGKWISAWILVAIAVQRFMAVFIPVKMRTLFSGRVPIAVLLTIVVFSFGVNVHFFFTFGLQVQEIGNVTYFRHCSKLAPYFVYEIWPYIDAVFGSFLPFVLLIICTIGILAQEIQRKQCLAARDSRTSVSGARTESRLAATTAMLLTVSFAFLLFTAPYFVWRLSRPFVRSSKDENADWTYIVAQFLQYTNHAVNFLLYCVSGTLFRQELVAIFKKDTERRVSTSMVIDKTFLRNSNKDAQPK